MPEAKQGLDKHDRRGELLAIAAGLFAEKGFKNTTVRDIADAAGILSGSLYHHFDSKESMVDEILRSFHAQEGQAHYAAAKAGVMALTRCAALDVAPHGIRVNAVSPSLAMHPFLAKVTSDDLLAELKQREAFGRAAEPWEVANVMVFLASDYSSYLTGEVVSVSSQHA